MKFIHLADVHWGMAPDADKSWSTERSSDIRESFARVIEYCGKESSDCLFISGDLFHRQPLLRELKEVNYLFSTIPHTQVFIIAGNHDHIRKNSALLSFQWAPNVHYFLGERLSSVYLESLRTEVHGFSYHSNELREPLSEYLGETALAPDRLHILMLHGGDREHLPMDLYALGQLPYHYLALGHIHKPQTLIENKAVFPGSLEPLDRAETGAHGFYQGELNPYTGKMKYLSFVPFSVCSYIPLLVRLTPETSNMELLSLLRREMQQRGPRNIYRIRLTGQHDPDLEFDFSSLERDFRIVDCSNEAEPQYDFAALFREHPSDMIGFYIRELLKENPEEMSTVEKKALYYGIHALLQTSEERSTL